MNSRSIDPNEIIYAAAELALKAFSTKYPIKVF